VLIALNMLIARRHGLAEGFLARFRFAVRVFKALGSWITLRRQARIVALFIPRRRWYRAAVYVSRLHAMLTGAIAGNRTLTEAVVLDSWLVELTNSGAYPIPWHVVKVDGLERGDPKRGVLYCWTHLPLFSMPLHAAIEMGYEMPVIVADPGKILGEDKFMVPGQTKRARAIPANLHVLMKIQTILEEGGSVACLADAELGGLVSSNVLRVAGQAGARVVFQWAERQPDGVINIYFINAPRPLNESEEDIEVNLEFLRVENRRILDSLGWGNQSRSS
jgi:hypothetical protein